MIADEEYKALKAESIKRASMTAEQSTRDRSVCLVATALPCQEVSQPEGVLGTLDLYAVRALDGEVLIGKFCSLASTCSSSMSRMLSHTASAQSNPILTHTMVYRKHLLLYMLLSDATWSSK